MGRPGTIGALPTGGGLRWLRVSLNSALALPVTTTTTTTLPGTPTTLRADVPAEHPDTGPVGRRVAHVHARAARARSPGRPPHHAAAHLLAAAELHAATQRRAAAVFRSRQRRDQHHRSVVAASPSTPPPPHAPRRITAVSTPTSRSKNTNKPRTQHQRKRCDAHCGTWLPCQAGPASPREAGRQQRLNFVTTAFVSPRRRCCRPASTSWRSSRC